MSEPFNFKVGDQVQFTIHRSNGRSHSFLARTGVVYRVAGDVLTIKYRGRFYTDDRESCRPVGAKSLLTEVVWESLSERR